MLQPKRVKFRKSQRGKLTGAAHRGNTIEFGEYGLQALESSWVSARQIEAARRAIVHHLHRRGRVWIRIYPDKAVTAKPAETRGGGGKGAVDHWVAVVRRERMLFEIEGVDNITAREAIRLAAHKLPIASRFVARDDNTSGNAVEMETEVTLGQN
jgi:large subunit ribosomal protein L16